MKVVIDLIENLREEIANDGSYKLTAMLLKEDSANSSKLIYAGEASITGFQFDDEGRSVTFSIDTQEQGIDVEELIKHLLIAEAPKMMYQLYIEIKGANATKEVVGFGVNQDEKKYGLFVI